MKDKFTVLEVADIFCVCEKTIRNRIKDSKIKVIKLFGKIYIPKEEIDRIEKEGIA